MKPITTFLLLLFLVSVSSPLVAQQPVITLSASTFYRGDAPGSYTVTCPANTSAALSVMTKIADVPLLDPASTQYAIGAVFPWPSVSNNPLPTLTGTLPQSYTTTVMSGTVTYNAGVLACNAYCNTGSFINTTSKSFTLTLGGMTRDEEAIYKTQKTYALRANAITLPRLTTADQTTLPPQQAGNLIYNTEQQKLAVHNGASWQYLASTAPEASQFRNTQAFTYGGTSSWTVPTGVTRIMVELWGGGGGGGAYTSNGNQLSASGGGAGGYLRGYMVVVPGTNLTITRGSGGSGGDRQPAVSPTPGGSSSIEPTTSSGGFVADGGSSYSSGGGGGLTYLSGYEVTGTSIILLVGGGSGTEITWTYGQQNATTYMWILTCGNGGTAYGAQPGGFGDVFQSSSTGNVGFYTGNVADGNNGGPKQGSFPGGGGGGGYNFGGNGGSGMIVLHW